jgi:hypothetical protein
MLYPSAQDWNNWGVAANLHRFFALHWVEMFDSETTDTWQVRTCNIRTILQELIDAAHVAETAQTPQVIKGYRQVLRDLLDEAFSVLRRDAVVKRFYPFIVEYLKPFQEGEIGAKDAAKVGQAASVVLGNLEGYWGQAVEVVTGMLAQGNASYKADLYDAAMTLAIEAVARGHSPEYIRSLFLSRVLTTRQEPFLERVQEVFGLLSSDSAEYKCTFIPEGVKRSVANILPEDIALRVGPPAAPDAAGAEAEVDAEAEADADADAEGEAAVGVDEDANAEAEAGPDAEGEAAGADEDADADAEEEFYSRGNANTVYLTITVSAVDQEAARHLAEQRLFQFFAGLNLYGVEDRFGLTYPDALVENMGGVKWRIDRREEVAYLNNSKSKYAKTGTLLRVHDRLNSEDAAQLMAALQYHRLALTATSDEARFVNLWVALESLCQGGPGSIISRVCARISPCVSISNVKKTITSLAMYIRHMWGGNHAQFLAIFPNSNPTLLKQEDLLRVLLLQPGTPDLVQLFALASHHPLICNRLYRVKTGIFDSPKSVANNLRYTRRNVEWQLKRIYRVRNEIVHKGSSSPRILRQLTQHLHTYLVTTLQAIVYELDRQPRWSMRDALEHKRRLFEHVVKFFDSTHGQKISQQALLNSLACLETQREPFAWVTDGEAIGEDGQVVGDYQI